MKKRTVSVAVIVFLLSLLVVGDSMKKLILKTNPPAPQVRDTDFGFSFQAPSELSIRIDGPNDVVKQSQSGQEIFGTVAPSYKTYLFAKGGKPLFEMTIFSQTDTPISAEGYATSYLSIHGKCDGRWRAGKPLPVRSFQVGDRDVLEVRGAGADHVVCYYFKSPSENLVVLSSEVFYEESKAIEASGYMSGLLATITRL